MKEIDDLMNSLLITSLRTELDLRDDESNSIFDSQLRAIFTTLNGLIINDELALMKIDTMINDFALLIIQYCFLITDPNELHDMISTAIFDTFNN